MKSKKHTPEQIVSKLRKVEALTAAGATVAEAAKQIGVSEQTVYRWKKQYGGTATNSSGSRNSRRRAHA